MPRRILTFALLLFLSGLAAGGALAQGGKRESNLRTVHGIVMDRDENPAPSSVVYLRNTRTLLIRTYIADDEGHYRFAGLDPNTDYVIHAEHGDMVSASRTISSFDSRKDIEVTLKLAHRKSGS